jgi:hypothetical protein
MSPVKLFTGVLLADVDQLPELEAELIATFGPIDHRSDLIPFEFTDYYAREMGDIVDRIFFSFEDLIDADTLADSKFRTNEIEQEYRVRSAEVPRPVNIDPGYLEEAKVVLASTKNFYHRLAIAQGVFAEVTMHFKNNTYQFFPWTYPAYKSKDYQEFFLRVRQIYRSQLRNRPQSRQK